MSTEDGNYDGLSDDREFELALGDLIRTALANDIEVSGGWRFDGVDGGHDFGVEIYRVVR